MTTFRTTQSRDRMRASKLMLRLYRCGMGELDMTKNQIAAALGVLRKIRPDLKLIEVSGVVEHRHTKDMTDEELLAIIQSESGSGQRVLPAPPSARSEPAVRWLHESELGAVEDPPGDMRTN